jgi:hypothetical protein
VIVLRAQVLWQFLYQFFESSKTQPSSICKSPHNVWIFRKDPWFIRNGRAICPGTMPQSFPSSRATQKTQPYHWAANVCQFARSYETHRFKRKLLEKYELVPSKSPTALQSSILRYIPWSCFTPLKIWHFNFGINIWPSPVCNRFVFRTPILSQHKLKKCAIVRCQACLKQHIAIPNPPISDRCNAMNTWRIRIKFNSVIFRC